MGKMTIGVSGSTIKSLVSAVTILFVFIFICVSAFGAHGFANSNEIPHNLSYLLSNTSDGYDALLSIWNDSADVVAPPQNLSYLLSNTGDGYDALLHILSQSKGN